MTDLVIDVQSSPTIIEATGVGVGPVGAAGQSAYETAVAEGGFTGTETEFAESLAAQAKTAPLKRDYVDTTPWVYVLPSAVGDGPHDYTVLDDTGAPRLQEPHWSSDGRTLTIAHSTSMTGTLVINPT